MSLDLEELDFGIVDDNDELIALCASNAIATKLADGYPETARVVTLYKNDNTKADVNWEF